MPQDYKIPQNIDIEDKILGPFTLVQFLYMIGGGILLYFLFLTIGAVNFGLFLLLAVPIAILTLALVFIRINERPFVTFLGYFSSFTFGPKLKRWHKSARIKTIMVQGIDERQQVRRAVTQDLRRGVVRSRLSELAQIMDTSGWGGVDSTIDMSGRIISEAATPIVRRTLQEEPLDDVFADLEQAMENFTVVNAAPTEEEIGDLAASLSRVLTKR